MADFENGDVIGISARMLFDSVHSIVNSYHVVLIAGGPATFAAVSVQLSAYMSTMYAFLTAALPNNQTALNLGVRNETQGTVWGAQSWGAWAGGSGTGDTLPLGVAMLIYGRTIKPRVQIRKYIGVIQEIDCADGVMQAGVRAAGLSVINYHILPQTPGGGITLQGCAYNRVTGVPTYAIGGATVGEACYQRRRRRGRGS